MGTRSLAGAISTTGTGAKCKGFGRGCPFVDPCPSIPRTRTCDPSNKSLRSPRTRTCHLSMNARLYFDWNATAPLRPEARAAVVAALDVIGNPSSVHAEGRAARRLVEEARESVAALVAKQAGQDDFTVSGTEANILALAPARPQRGASKLLVSSVEHASV